MLKLFLFFGICTYLTPTIYFKTMQIYNGEVSTMFILYFKSSKHKCERLITLVMRSSQSMNTISLCQCTDLTIWHSLYLSLFLSLPASMLSLDDTLLCSKHLLCGKWRSSTLCPAKFNLKIIESGSASAIFKILEALPEFFNSIHRAY